MISTLQRSLVNRLQRSLPAARTLPNWCYYSVLKAMEEYTQVKECNGVREITLCHAKTHNALSLDMMHSLQERLMQDLDSLELRCIVLTAKGKVWSSGHNLKELAAGDECTHRAVFEKLLDITKCVERAPVPVIAKINGLITAGGCQLAASCDMVICSDTSRFQLPTTNFGVFPATPAVTMTRVMQRQLAAYMLLTGQAITAQEACVAGLATRVVPEAELDAEVERITDAIRAKSRAVLQLGKQFFYEQLEMKQDDAYEKGIEVMCENLQSPDAIEGITSFVEKRKPKWSHK